MRHAFMLITLLLVGCVSTPSLKADDCATTNWQAIGYEDGKRGADSKHILRYMKTCQGTTAPDRPAWEIGRQKGLTEFCTPNNAYNLGRMGHTLTGVCDDNTDKLEPLHRANMMGLEQYALRKRLDYYHYGYFYGHPWYAPHYW